MEWQRVYGDVAEYVCLDTKSSNRWMRKHRYVPPRFNNAAMLLQYVTDARLDETLHGVLGEYFPIITFHRLIAHTRLTLSFLWYQ